MRTRRPKSRRSKNQWADHYTRRAKREAFPARSVYKLQEIQKRFRVIRKGGHVLDLGCAPGSWTQYAAELTGPGGTVIGIDLKKVGMALPAHVRLLQGDILVPDATITAALAPGFDTVISDMAPKTSGQRHADQYRSYELVMRALDLAKQVLVPGGTFVAKIFQGAEFEEARSALREAFGKVRIIRPEATRDESYEVFLVGLGFRPAAT